ncbi:MAG TPA: ATP-binding protein [Candidatus Limnocylindria bacterium]|nr:ATP-binding protein [Candidatus Limnocylindria bacterium]
MSQRPPLIPTAEAHGAQPGQASDMLQAQLLARQTALDEIAQRALAEERLEHLLSETSRLVAEALDVTLVSVAELNQSGDLLLVAGAGWPAGVLGQLVLGAEDGSLSGYRLKVGGPLLVEDLRRERRFTVVPELLENGARAGLSARIGGPEQPYGVLSAWSGRAGHFTPDDGRFLQAVANVLAGGVSRLRVEAELRRSRDELEAIVANVHDGILVRARDGRLLYANEAAARLLQYSSAGALLAAPAGEPEKRFTIFDEDGEGLTRERMPSRVALDSGRQTPERLVRVLWHASGEERWQILQATPLHNDDESIDKVVVVIRDITEQRRETANRQFLTEALATVSATLDQEEAARRLARLSVPRLGDYCAVDLLDVDGSIVPAALVHVEPEAAALAWRRRRERPLRPDDASGPAHVIRTGTPEWVPSAPRRGQPDEPTDIPTAHLLELGVTSWLRVPLLARGRSIGALTVGRRASEPPLDKYALDLAQELGARAGIALENARLFETARDRRAELDAVLAAMADSVLVFDASGHLRLTNRAAEELFTQDPPLTQDPPRTVERLRQRVRPDPERVRQLDPNAVAGRGETGDALADLEGEVQLAGSERWYELRRYRSRRTPADRGERHGPFVVVLRDVTEARAARAARDAFLGVLSHELRTPITTIYGGSELLERALAEDQREEVVRDIRAESERLARLVEDLLVMTHVERGGVEIGDEPVLMQRLIPSVARSLQMRLPGLEIELGVEENLPAVRGDATYLEQVLRNLMTNAVRYGAGLEHGIRVEAETSSEERLFVRVIDHGPGLGEEDPEKLFDLFYRSPSAKAVPGGAGIGLFVCRRLAEAMGGGIRASSRPEGGSEFVLYLPTIEPDVA